MGFLGFVVAAFAAWAVWTGRLRRMTMLDGMMIGLALVGAVMAGRGNPLWGGGMLALSLIYALRRRAGRTASLRAPPEPAAVAEARQLLGLGPDADEQAVRDAHRRLIAKVHPDAGGTSALAEKLNEARAILLGHLISTHGSHRQNH